MPTATSSAGCGSHDAARCTVRLAALELQRLQNRLVVLILVLRHHRVDVAIAQQRIAGLEIERLQLVQHALAHLGQDLEHLLTAGQVQGTADPPRVLERIVDAGHLAELHGAVDVPVEPQLLEVGDVAEVPDDRAHERIVLHSEIVVRERLDQPNCPGASFAQQLGDSVDLGVDARVASGWIRPSLDPHKGSSARRLRCDGRAWSIRLARAEHKCTRRRIRFHRKQREPLPAPRDLCRRDSRRQGSPLR